MLRQIKIPAPHAKGPEPVVEAAPPVAPAIQPSTSRSNNPLRPSYLHDMIGQQRMVALLRRLIEASATNGRPLDHMLLVGPAGMGKTTIANVVSNEIGSRVFQTEAPVSHETLMALRTIMQDHDILFVDEAHQQAIMQRRGRDSSTQPEVLLSLLEDGVILTPSGPQPFPRITVIAATTDEGMLPTPFIERFPIRPTFEPYGIIDLGVIADYNAGALDLTIDPAACLRFAQACRGVPRVVNNFVKNAASLVSGTHIDEDVAIEVIEDLNGVTEDGLTRPMQAILTFLYTRCKRRRGDGTIAYEASVATIATATGRGRDQKAVFRDEGYLIEQGYLYVGPRGRGLTDTGITKATELLP